MPTNHFDEELFSQGGQKIFSNFLLSNFYIISHIFLLTE